MQRWQRQRVRAGFARRLRGLERQAAAPVAATAAWRAPSAARRTPTATRHAPAAAVAAAPAVVNARGCAGRRGQGSALHEASRTGRRRLQPRHQRERAHVQRAVAAATDGVARIRVSTVPVHLARARERGDARLAVPQRTAGGRNTLPSCVTAKAVRPVR
eukprot:158740-Chlamydomonas_euryale.AAC.1